MNALNQDQQELSAGIIQGPTLRQWAGVCLLGLSTWFGAFETLADDILIPAGSVWSYLDTGTDQGAAWRGVAFEDGAWVAGHAPLGYGEGNEGTRVSYGPNSSSKYITTYFRHEFTVADVSDYETLRVRLVRDDGAVIYLNGVEIFRSNMPSGTVGYRTLASSNVGGAAETNFLTAVVSSSALAAGPNVVAVELHQASTNSSDLRFDFELSGCPRPVTVALLEPGNEAQCSGAHATLKLAVDGPRNTVVQATVYGREALPLGPDFTIIALPDTQYYTGNKNGGTPQMAVDQIEWIVRERSRRNIVFMTQLGDCVENGDNGGNDVEWRNATNALYRLENPLTTLLEEGIPYGVAVGNHDFSTTTNGTTTSFYNQYFGVDHFEGRDYYGGHHGEHNDNHYELFSASGLDFIIIHLMYDTTPDAAILDWADSVLKAYPSRRAIITSHYLAETGNPAPFGAQGRAVYEALKDNPNLFLMLCGHVPGEGQRADVFEGRTVYTLMSDYQGRINGGDGWLRLLEFSPSNGVIRVKTYSPTKDQFETDADSEFTLPYDMRDYSRPFLPVATVADAPAGTTLEVTWNNLMPGRCYEWQARVQDGTNTISSPICRFHLEPQAGIAGGPEVPAPRRVPTAWHFDRTLGQIQMTWPTTPGAIYEVVYKNDLSETEWQPLSGDLTAEGETLNVSVEVTGGQPQRFFLVRAK